MNKKIFGFQRNVFALGWVSFFMDVSSEMIYPLIPIFLSNVLGANKSIIGLIEGTAESTASLLKVVSGYISDRIKKKKGTDTIRLRLLNINKTGSGTCRKLVRRSRLPFY